MLNIMKNIDNFCDSEIKIDEDVSEDHHQLVVWLLKLFVKICQQCTIFFFMLKASNVYLTRVVADCKRT